MTTLTTAETDEASDPAGPPVQAEGLVKVYGSRSGPGGGTPVRALDGVDLTVDEGEIFGLLGPNGAGKSTLVKILVTAVWPTGGRARLFGLPVEDPRSRRRIGYLPDGHRLPGFLTAENLLHVYGRASGMSRGERARRVPEVLATVGLEDRRRSKVATFSKGMVQRLALGQAILHEPDLVFLDEPTDGVDPGGRLEIRDLILSLRDCGTTVFINSHMLSEVEQVCDRVAILHRGGVVRQGGLRELTSTEDVYVLRATPLPEELVGELEVVEAGPEPARESAAPAARGPVREYRVSVKSRVELNRLVDRLRAAGVELESLAPLRRSLEEYFLDVVNSEGSDEGAS